MPELLHCPKCDSLNTHYRGDVPWLPEVEGDPYGMDDHEYQCTNCAHVFLDSEAEHEQCLKLADLAHEVGLDRDTLWFFVHGREPRLATFLRMYHSRATHFVTRTEAERWKAAYAEAPKVGRRK